MLPEDDFDGETEPLDLLDAQKTRSVLSTNKLKRKNDDSDDDLEIDLDGRFIVPDENMMKKKRASKGKDDVDMQSTRSGKSNGKMKSNRQGSKKRKIETGWAYTGEEYTNKKGNRNPNPNAPGSDQMRLKENEIFESIFCMSSTYN